MENGSGGYGERFVRSFLDWLILSILRKRPAYGHEMLLEIQKEFHVAISSGSFYPILHNLEHTGLVNARWDDPDRRSTKVYEITLEGLRAHRDGFDSIDRILISHQHPPGKLDDRFGR
jgi:DNA-binding PadR family transcriptional regulator